MCFDLGEAGDVAARKPPIALMRMPFEYAWLEIGSMGGDASIFLGGLLARGDKNDEIAMWLWNRCDRLWTFQSKVVFTPGGALQGHLRRKIDAAGIDLAATGAFRMETPSGGDASIGGFTLEQVSASSMLAGLAVLNCSNIVTRRHDPDPKLQKARAKRGKQPLFSYHTLEIDPQASREAGVDQGGTHASPRVHLRRGHIRKFAPGKWCWVRETIVRGITPGMVHKDYALKGAVH